MSQDQKVICADGTTHKPEDCEKLIKEYIMKDDSMIPLYRALFISQYFMILKVINDIKDAEQSSEDEKTDNMTCNESIDEVGYTHWCDKCNLSTFYCQKPPKDYPHQLCLTDECIAEHIIKVVVKEHEKLYDYDEHPAAEEQLGQEDDDDQ